MQKLLATQVEAQQRAQAERRESRAQQASDFTRRGFDGGLGALPRAPPTGFLVSVAAEPSWRAQPRPPLVAAATATARRGRAAAARVATTVAPTVDPRFGRAGVEGL